MAAVLRPFYLDNHLLAVAKPAGLLCVPDRTGAPSLVELMADWLRTATGRAHLLSVHRLDRAVSGCVVFARTTKAAQRLGAAFRDGGPDGARKLYLARTAPLPADALELRAAAAAFGSGARARGGVAQVWLAERGRRVVARAGPFDGAALARVRWEARSARLADGGLLLALEPAGGKRHQLRAAAAVGLRAPLLWDALYGAPPRPQAAGDAEERITVGLHACALELPHPTARTEAAASELARGAVARAGVDALCADGGAAEWRGGRLLLRASPPAWWAESVEASESAAAADWLYNGPDD